jgi:hypothetical protein
VRVRREPPKPGSDAPAPRRPLGLSPWQSRLAAFGLGLALLAVLAIASRLTGDRDIFGWGTFLVFVATVLVSSATSLFASADAVNARQTRLGFLDSGWSIATHTLAFGLPCSVAFFAAFVF